MLNSRPALECRKVLAIVLAAATTVSAAGCTAKPPPSFEGYNVVVIVVDALRASALGGYGYPRDTSPFLDSLGAGGLVFTQASSTSSFTRESVASLFTGKLPSSGGGTGWGAAPGRTSPTLAQLFRAQGYRTGLESNSVMLFGRGFRRGFGWVQFPGQDQMVSGGQEALTRDALRFVRSASEEKFFLYMHYLDPHGPYEPDAASLERFPDRPSASAPVRLYGEVRDHCSELRAGGFAPGDPRFEELRLRYDAEVARTDAAIRDFFTGLEAAGVLDRTLVIVTADHGEEFLEHGFVEHAWTLYEESLHVPLILWAPQRIEARESDVRVSLVDLVPTLSLLFGLSAVPGDGRALVRPSEGSWAPVEDDVARYAELLIQTRSILHSVTDGDWKYIVAQRWLDHAEREQIVRTKRAGAFPAKDLERVDPWGAAVREELYQLRDDPSERVNLVASEPEVLDSMRSLMGAYRQRVSGVVNTSADTLELSEEQLRQLESLGYQ